VNTKYVLTHGVSIAFKDVFARTQTKFYLGFI
jgi:hypothetical protein